MKSRKMTVLIIILVIVAIGGLYVNLDREEPKDEEEVDLYFADSQAQYLVQEKRIVSNDALYLNTLEALLAGPGENSYSSTLPAATRIEDFKLNGNTAEVSFNQAFRDQHWGGSTGERLTVYSVVNTLTQFPEIERVRILLAGEEMETLAGHMDLTLSFEYNQDIVQE